MRRRAVFPGSQRTTLLAAVLAAVVTLGAAASERPAYFDEPAEVVPPVRYNRNRRYPVFVLLPPTGAHASDVARNFGLDPAAQEEFLLLFPAGRPTRDEYLTIGKPISERPPERPQNGFPGRDSTQNTGPLTVRAVPDE